MKNEKLRKVIEQIGKLLALSASSNEHEAALALDMARKLMLKYNIEETDLKDSNEEIIEIDFKIAHSASDYTQRFAYWLGRSFFVQPILIKTNVGKNNIKFEYAIRFVGRRADVAVSSYIFSYMTSILNGKAKEYFEQSNKKDKNTKQEFSLGFITAICEKLEKIEEERMKQTNITEETQINALVLVSNALIKKYMEENYKDDLFNPENSDVEFNPEHYTNGYIEGQKQGIYSGVENKENNKFKLTNQSI